MAMNYKEVSQGASANELKKYAKGINLVDSFVDSLAAEGLLPPRFKPTRATLRGTETTLVLPEGAIRLPDVRTVGMSNGEMERLADSTRGLNIGDWGRNIIKRAPIAPNEHLTLSPVTLDARTMRISDEYPTTKKVWDKAKKFGDRVTAEEMLQIAIEAAKGNIQVEIGKPLVGIMDPVADSIGSLSALYVGRYVDGLWLDASYAYPAYQWYPDRQFVVSSRK